MTSEDLKFWLPVLFTIYLGMIYFWSMLRSSKPIKIHGEVDKKFLRKWLGIRIISKIFRILLMISTFIILSFSYFPGLYSIFYPFHALDRLDINMLGFAVLLFAVCWMLVTQFQLGSKIIKYRKNAYDSPPKAQEIFTSEENILLGILIMLCGIFISISSLIALIISLASIIIYFIYYIFIVVKQDKFLL